MLSNKSNPPRFERVHPWIAAFVTAASREAGMVIYNEALKQFEKCSNDPRIDPALLGRLFIKELL